MKDEEKHIEEMAYVVCRLRNKPLSCANCMWKVNCNEYDNARTHFNLGYRKIDKDNVVLSKEGYELLLECSSYEGVMKALKNEYTKGSKETAEKFVNLPDSDILVVDTQEYGEINVVSVERLQELAKQLGVEIKES